MLNLDFANLSSEQQTLVDELILFAQELLESKECNRKFEQDTFEEFQNGTDEAYIYIKNPPIDSITSIKQIADDGSETLLESDKYRYNANIGEICLLSGCFQLGCNNYEITYVGGFDPVPRPIKKLIADMVMEAFDPSTNDDIIDREKIGDYFYSKVTGFSKILLVNKRRITSQYRIWKV